MQEKFIEVSKNARLVGAAAVVIKNGKITETLSYGLSSIEANTPMTAYTVIRIASVSKTIMALGLMKLVEIGRININDDISKYLGFKIRNPKYPNTPITIKMMLTQTSSIMDGPVEGKNGYNNVNGTNLDASLASLLLEDGAYFTPETWDDSEPGTNFIYSNFNCGILSCIIERVSGEYFTTYMINNIFKPLGLDASYIAKDIINPDIASLYLTEGEEVKLERNKESFVNNKYKLFPLGENYRGPAGGLFINMIDLSRLAQVFLAHGYPLLKEETIKEMMKVHWQGPRTGSYTAKGLQMKITDDFGLRLYGHFGSAYGAKSYMLFNVEKQIAMVYITNGGFYRYLESEVCDIHDAMIREFIKEYA